MNFLNHISLIKTENLSSELFTKSKVRNFEINSDEPIELGGENLAPTPFDLLNSALASCTSIYLRKIATKQNINIGKISVKIVISKNEEKNFYFERNIIFENYLTEEEYQFLLESSENTPVTRILKENIKINTNIKGTSTK
jgi:putative redox protein